MMHPTLVLNSPSVHFWSMASLLLLLAALGAASAESSGAALREVVRNRRCLPEGRQSVFPFSGERLWVFEVNDWTSQQLTTAVAAILLKEHAGYGVDINHVTSGTGVYQRIAKDSARGVAMEQHFNSGRQFGYANLEVWPAGQRDKYLQYVTNDGVVRDSTGGSTELSGPLHFEDMGFVGYEGRSGWFVSQAFAEDPRFPITPEFYRAYDRAGNGSRPVIQALQAESSVLCGSPGVCTGISAVECPGSREPDDVELVWCPPKVDGATPAVLAKSPFVDQGFNEEIAQGNGFRFAVRYVGLQKFSTASYEALANGIAQVIHIWRPSLTMARLQREDVKISRVMLPSEDCGEHRSDGRGDWSCDFPLQALSKLASVEAKEDPVINKFLRKFSIPQGTEDPTGPPSESLEGGGLRELLSDLLSRMDDTAAAAGAGAAASIRPATAEEIFDTACDWVKSNEHTGARWNYWVEARNVPFFADTLHWLYPLPFLLALSFAAIAYIVFLEWPWLHTTLTRSSTRRIMARTGHCRTDLELRLREAARVKPIESKPLTLPLAIGRSMGHMSDALPLSPKMRGSTSIPKTPTTKGPNVHHRECTGLTDNYWKGLAERAFEIEEVKVFWKKVEQWTLEARSLTELPAPKPPPVGDYVYLAHHSFPCLQQHGRVSIPLLRSSSGAASGQSLEVELVVSECDGGAKKGRDFGAGTHRVVFAPGEDHAVVNVPIKHHLDQWQNSYWFQVRLTSVLSGGGGIIASPAEAIVLVLSEEAWPANIPETKRGGAGISLMRYFIYLDRLRRGEKWRKTMIGMCWLPVHSVFISTIVQKVLVDHVVKGIQNTTNYADIVWFYTESVILIIVQLISLGLNRWADVVQTRNRGRTGGIRQVHRGELLRKFMHMEHSEHWLASDASWLYALIYDADVVTGKAYFSVFELFQSITALFLSLVLAIGLAFWAWSQNRGTSDARIASPGTWQAIWYILGVVIIIPLGLFGVWFRRKLMWAAVIARKDLECAWFKSCTWIITHWRQLYGLSGQEKVALEKRVLKQNSEFIPAHWDARDTMNDTAWVTHWIQGVAYCFMLIFGLFALCEYSRFGIGAMEVGTYYALCKIYLSVGKYVGRLSGVFVDMQQAVVSLREIAALNNQVDQRSQRREARRWAARIGSRCKASLLRHGSSNSLEQNVCAQGITIAHGMCFVRPMEHKVGSTFAELKLRACTIPLGCIVHVSLGNERVLRSFLGLISQVIHPTDAMGQELPDDAEGVSVPNGLKVNMLPVGSVGMGTTAPSLLDQLEFTGAPKDLCHALAEAVGLEPHRETASLGMGSMQVFSIIRAILVDPDVLCAFRPLAFVPMDMRMSVHMLLRLWQGGGGLPRVAEFLGCPLKQGIYRTSTRSLIIGNPEQDLWGGFKTDVHLDLARYLWKGPDLDPSSVGSTTSSAAEGSPWRPSGSPTPTPKLRLGRGLQDKNIQDIWGGS
mmetsp:Transcript_24144/g.77752  ORF Transcript_24144/g.77752 Transcript_24144/m.77752 type:complete len:1462 (-) Transcript_24144:77-4462(-)